MKKADDWFAEYDVFHQNGTNKVLHAVCIPLIMFSLIGLLWSIPLPSGLHPLVNVATIVSAMSLIYYFALSPALAVAMTIVSVTMLAGTYYLAQAAPGSLAWISLGLFVVGWIGQFVGHKIEGKKPAFFDDLRFLLIGPLWLVGFLYRRWHVRY